MLNHLISWIQTCSILISYNTNCSLHDVCIFKKKSTMKYIIIIILFLSNTAFSQVISGAAKDEGRKLLNKPAFVIEGMTNGYAKYELAINREGNVTSSRKVKSNIRMTPAQIAIKNYVNKFKFQKGTIYPKFHHVVVKVTMLKKKVDTLKEID